MLMEFTNIQENNYHFALNIFRPPILHQNVTTSCNLTTSLRVSTTTLRTKYSTAQKVSLFQLHARR